MSLQRVAASVESRQEEKESTSTPGISLPQFSHLPKEPFPACVLDHHTDILTPRQSWTVFTALSLAGLALLLFSSAIQSGQWAINARLKLGSHLISDRVGRETVAPPTAAAGRCPRRGGTPLRCRFCFMCVPNRSGCALCTDAFTIMILTDLLWFQTCEPDNDGDNKRKNKDSKLRKH